MLANVRNDMDIMQQEIFGPISPVMAFFPGEIVMVFHAGNNLSARQFTDEPVNHRVVGCRVFAHEIHRMPILLSCLAIEVEPGQSAQILVALGQRRQVRVRVALGEPEEQLRERLLVRRGDGRQRGGVRDRGGFLALVLL